MKYSVEYWGSHPDSDNDDCWQGWDFPTFAEAKKRFDDPAGSSYCDDYTIAFVVLSADTGETRDFSRVFEIIEIRENPSFDPARVERERRRDNERWQHEIAMEAGMLHGIDAFNAEMGY